MTKIRTFSQVSPPALLAALLCTTAAHAGDGVVVKAFPRYEAIAPASAGVRNKQPNPDVNSVTADASANRSTASSAPKAARSASTRAYGTFGIPYTSVRVQDSAPAGTATNANRLSTTYPYRTVGRLDITTSSGSGHCSASLIMRSVMVTAAHCAADFGSNTWFNSWTFRPGHYGPPGATLNQIQPFGAWTIELGVVASSWLNGTDSGYGAARNNDVAVFIVQKNISNQFIGDVVGWMTYGTGNYSFVRSRPTKNLWTAATTTLGYPALMDGGTIMQRADGPTFLTKVKKAFQMWQGNNFTAGSSGGPWIVNFGYTDPNFTGGANGGLAAVMNVVVGVTSWGSSDPNYPKDNYSSQFSQNREFPASDYGGYGAGNIGALLQALCTTVKPGGSSTYAALGYCD